MAPTRTSTTNLAATSIGLLVVGAALVCSQAGASSLARADSDGDGEHLLSPRPKSDTELNGESQVRSSVSLMSPASASSLAPPSGAQLATALLRSRRWAFLSSQSRQQQAPLLIRSGPNGDGNARDSYPIDAPLDKEAMKSILLQVLDDYERSKMTQPQLQSAPANYDKWVENNKDVAMDELIPHSAQYARLTLSDQALGAGSAGDYYPSSIQSFEKREHVKPCLFNAISCPKYPFRNKGYK